MNRSGAATIARWLFVTLALLAVALPRFDLKDPGPIRRFTSGATSTAYGLPIDVEGYRRLSEYYRGSMPADSMLAPFCFRPLVPALASALPWSSQTSINVVNLLALLLTVVVLDRLTKLLGYGDRARFVGSLLFVISFPTFYYGTIGFVDPPTVLAVTLAALLTLQGRQLALFAVVPLAVLIKETSAWLSFLPLAWAWARGRIDARSVGISVGLFSSAVATVAAVHARSDFPDPGFIWIPQVAGVLRNAVRPRTWISLFLTLGLPALLAGAALLTGRAAALRREQRRFLVAGTVMALGLYAYSLTSAYADGRVVWVAIPFLLPLAIAWFDSRSVPVPSEFPPRPAPAAR